jgi:hypothetical protein
MKKKQAIEKRQESPEDPIDAVARSAEETATWRRSDGLLVQFSETGWRSTDPGKNDWLVKMSKLCSAAPVIPPVIKMWLEEYCELIGLEGPADLFNNKQPRPQ